MRSFILFNSLTSLVLAGLLTACGGGGGGSAPPAADTPTPTPTVLASAYVGTASSPGFWAVVQSTQSGGEFLAMNYNGVASSSVSTTLYSGKVQAGVNGAVAASGLRTMRADGTVRDGTASFSEASVSGFAARFDALISAEAASHSALAVAPLDAVAGNWAGRWVDGVSSNTNLSLPGLASGGTAVFTVANCNSQLTVGPWQAASGLYAVQLTYPINQNLCLRQGTQLKGWAFVQLKETKQILRFMAVDTSGSGISFSAER